MRICAIRSKRRKNLSAVIIVSSILSVSLLVFVSPSVRSFHCSNNFGSRSRRQFQPNQIHRNHESPIINSREGDFHVGVRTYSVASSSTTYLSASYLRELDSVDDLREGSLVISRVEESLGCHDLRQPYFHKAVVLILEHDPDDFTQGVLLNRASDLVLDDRDIVYIDEDEDEDEDDNDQDDSDEQQSSSPESWKIHFGGDIGGWYEEVPQLLCLHGISSEAALAVSDPIFGWEENGSNTNDYSNNVYITSHMGAQSLVKSGEATSDMFYTFSGFCGWEKDQLQPEVDRGSWCLASFHNAEDQNDLVSFDSKRTKQNHRQHVLMDLIEKHSWKNPNYKPQSGGLELWHKAMAELGKDKVEPTLPKDPQPFSDLMVKEWATQRLLMTSDGSDKDDTEEKEEPTSQIDDEDIFRALKIASSDSSPLLEGKILRGSSSPSSPYLVTSQLFHKSTILVLRDTPKESVGVILNLPTKDAYVLHIDENNKDYHFPIRYGGPSGKEDGEEDDSQYFWLHDNELLKDEEIGVPVRFANDWPAIPETATDEDFTGIHVCELADVYKAIELELARSEDFILVKGFCAWEKEDKGSAGGLTGQFLNGNLEDTHWMQKTERERESLWKSLLKQKQIVSEECLKHNLALSLGAWEQGGCGNEKAVNESNPDDDIRLVFDSTITISELADDALFAWMKVFLLFGNAVYWPTDL